MKLERIIILAALVSLMVTLPVAAVIEKVAAHPDATNIASHLQLKIASTSHKDQSTLISKKGDPSNTPAKVESKPSPQPQPTPVQQEQKPAVSVSTPAPAAAAPAPTPAPTYAPGCEQYRSLISQYSWNVNIAMAIMEAESGCRAVTPDNSAINYDGIPDYGLFQLHGIAVTDPAENIRIAYTVKYVNQGWGAWSTYKSGAYLKFLR